VTPSLEWNARNGDVTPCPRRERTPPPASLPESDRRSVKVPTSFMRTAGRWSGRWRGGGGGHQVLLCDEEEEEEADDDDEEGSAQGVPRTGRALGAGAGGEFSRRAASRM